MADQTAGERAGATEEDGRISAGVGRLSRCLRLGQLATRAAAQTGLITANTYQVAHGHWLGVFVVGCAISWLWWANAGHAGRSTDPFDGLIYGLAAGVGSVSGLLIAEWVYRV